MERFILIVAPLLAVSMFALHAALMLGAIQLPDWVTFPIMLSVFTTTAPVMWRHPKLQKRGFSARIRPRDALRGAPWSMVVLLFVALAYVGGLMIHDFVNGPSQNPTAIFTGVAGYLHLAAIVLVLSGRAQREVDTF